MSMHTGDHPESPAIMLTQMPDWTDTMRLQSAALRSFQENLPEILLTNRLRTSLLQSESTRGMAKRFEEGLVRGPDPHNADLIGLAETDVFRQHRLNTSNLQFLVGLGGFVAGSLIVGGARAGGLTISFRAQPGAPNGRWSYALASVEPNMTFSAGLECAAWARALPAGTAFFGAQVSLNDGMGGVARVYVKADSHAPEFLGFSVGVGISLGFVPMGVGVFYGQFYELSE